MKKLFALVLTLCLLCGMTALAEDTTINQDTEEKQASTSVSYTITPCEEYTVTIPSSVTLTTDPNNSTKLQGNMQISLNADKFNVPGKSILVKLQNRGESLKTQNDANSYIAYSVLKTNAGVQLGDTILSWAWAWNGAKQASVTLDIAASISAALSAGTYTDTMTFSVSVEQTTAEIATNGNEN